MLIFSPPLYSMNPRSLNLFMLLPVHAVIFGGMLRAISRRAQGERE